jgi:O-antigen ligase
MTNAILVVGLGLVIVLAVLMVQRVWRLPALMFGLLAIPGNVDNLLPQMTLDPNELANSTSPAVSVVDLLVLWAVVLTVREGRLEPREGRPARIPPWLLGLAGILALVACLAAAAAVLGGVEPMAAGRGAIVFLRIVAVLYLAANLINSTGDAFRLALGIAAGGAVLLANGIYSTTVNAQVRFTASTFGQNTFAIALVIVVIAAAGIALSRWRNRRASRRDAAIVTGSLLIASTALFGAVATGTRMSLVALAGAGLLVLLLNRGWRTRMGLVRVGTVALVAVAIIGTATILTSGGSRTVSIITAPESTIQAVMDPGSLPIYSAIRSRGDFWGSATRMAIENPVLGVGPFQWNFERYRYASSEPLVVADVHNAYLQSAAEYGLPVAALYLLLLGACLSIIVLAARGRASSAQTDLTVAAIAGAGFAYTIADITNSNLFNVRMGLVGWLLIAIAVVYAVGLRQDRQADPVPTSVG